MENSDRNKIRIFVYGTLRQGFGLNYLLNFARFHSDGYVYGTMYDLGSFPGIILSNDKTKKVVGEIYFIDKDTLNKLDHVEGFSPDNLEHSLYIRKPVIIFNSNHEEEFGYIYEYNKKYDGTKIVESGDWSEREKELREKYLLSRLSRKNS
jgi:gamma-glutamylcyclotransferase (GGCT)/AIG2-like uncharacterized protein YtfP